MLVAKLSNKKSNTLGLLATKGLKETIEWYLNNKSWVENLWQKKKDEMNKFQSNLERSEEKMKSST